MVQICLAFIQLISAIDDSASRQGAVDANSTDAPAAFPTDSLVLAHITYQARGSHFWEFTVTYRIASCFNTQTPLILAS